MVLDIFKSRITSLFQYWTRLSYVKYVLFSIILTLILTIPFAVLFEFMGINDRELGGPQMDKLGIGGAFFLGIIFAPIFETLIGQMIPIKIIQKYVKWNTNKVAVIASSSLFALGHISYSFWYFLITLPIGFVLAVTFIVFQTRTQSSFWTTTIIHAGRNSVALIFTFGDQLK
jgi:membrane protease YdiL (CAAX protease family)